MYSIRIQLWLISIPISNGLTSKFTCSHARKMLPELRRRGTMNRAASWAAALRSTPNWQIAVHPAITTIGPRWEPKAGTGIAYCRSSKSLSATWILMVLTTGKKVRFRFGVSSPIVGLAMLQPRLKRLSSKAMNTGPTRTPNSRMATFQSPSQISTTGVSQQRLRISHRLSASATILTSFQTRRSNGLFSKATKRSASRWSAMVRTRPFVGAR